MDTSQQDLLNILLVARETSFRGSGISLVDAVAKSRYVELRSRLVPNDLIPVLAADPGLVEDWLLYSGDKRTDGGWYVLETGEVGSIRGTEPAQFPNVVSAVAEYVLRELDSCVGLAA